jgi:hypothetical protein
MASSSIDGAVQSGADPFSERSVPRYSASRMLLGARFRFASDSEALLAVVDAAYEGLPQHQWPAAGPELYVELRLSQRPLSSSHSGPPPVTMQSGAGVLCGIMDAWNYAVVTAEHNKALVIASADMLRNTYHLRYELIEFAVFVLASRAMGLVPLHAACVGQHGQGVLLLGDSGAGKSTLALGCLLQGLEFLAEDAVFVEPQRLLATGVANYLHLQADALQFVDDAAARHWISEAPLIRRRSGVQKTEADLRQSRGSLAATPLALTSVVFLSSELARDSQVLLRPIPEPGRPERVAANQPYAAGQPGWHDFQERLLRLPFYELRRAEHPRAAVAALRRLIDTDLRINTSAQGAHHWISS